MDGEDYEIHRPKYAHNKAMCTETRYADSYVTMTNRSPFAAMRPNPAGGAPVTKWVAFNTTDILKIREEQPFIKVD